MNEGLTIAVIMLQYNHVTDKEDVMPVIRIGDATWDKLKRWAVPLEDSPDDALRKVLVAAEEHLKCNNHIGLDRPERIDRNGGKTTRLRAGMKVPQKAYEDPILEALYELRGKGHVGEVLSIVERKVEHLLGEVDRELVPSGTEVRWANTAKWARSTLVKQGMLRNDSTKGVWELTEEGEKTVQRRLGPAAASRGL